MAIIPTPASLKIRGIAWRLISPSQVNRSGWTGRRQVFGTPGHSRWTAEAEIAVLAEADAFSMRSFMVKLEGSINTFRLEAVEREQTAVTTLTVAAAVAAGAMSVTTSASWPASTTVLKEGQMLTINDQLLVLTADVVSNTTGGSTMTFKPRLRVAAAAGTAIEVKRPTALVALSEPEIGWAVELGPHYSFALSVEEVF